MTQNTSDDSDRNEATSFFKKWINSSKEGLDTGNWDEVCFQWCKQKDNARKDKEDPNCKMYCFRKPVTNSKEKQSNDSNSWNPLSGYKIVVVDGVEQCVTHVKDMNSLGEKSIDSSNENLSPNSSRYELDLGNLWTETKGEAKNVFDAKVKPFYYSSVEQAKEWKKSPEAQQAKDYVREQVDKIYTRVFQTSPPIIVNSASPSESAPMPEDLKKDL